MPPLNRKHALTLAALALLLLAACAPGPNPMKNVAPTTAEPAGFLLGFWHGIIIWVTFIVSLFSDHVSIYEVHNTGWPYNLGFVLGAACFHGGGGAAGSRRARRR